MAAIEGVEQPDALIDLAEQQRAGVGGEPAAAEVGDDGLGSEAGKVERFGVTVCHRGGLAAWRSGIVANPYPTRS